MALDLEFKFLKDALIIVIMLLLHAIIIMGAGTNFYQDSCEAATWPAVNGGDFGQESRFRFRLIIIMMILSINFRIFFFIKLYKKLDDILEHEHF